jgi:DNA repair protein RadA/Sms
MALAAMSKDRRALLVTGEESTAQVKLRAARLGGAEGVEILAETELDTVCATLERELPDVCVIDSIQTLYSAELGSAPGSVAQVREAAARLLRVAKENGIAIILVGHVTKDGAVAGPRVLEHLVDCVLQFEGDRYHAHRILRAAKNRFGSTNELGVFEMTGTGLVGVPDPSALFGKTEDGEIGAAVACALEGTRPILLEIQSLVAPSDLAMPRRVGTGVDPKRRRRSHRRARRRPRDRAGDRLRGQGSPRPQRSCGLRRDRPHGPPSGRNAGRSTPRGVHEARNPNRAGPGRYPGPWQDQHRRAGNASKRDQGGAG